MTIEASKPEGQVRQIRLGMVGGGQGAFIGAVHRIAARMDDNYALVAGALSGDGLFTGNRAELGTVRADSRPNPNASGRVDDDVNMPYTDSLNAGVEYELGRGFGTVSYTHLTLPTIYSV